MKNDICRQGRCEINLEEALAICRLMDVCRKPLEHVLTQKGIQEVGSISHVFVDISMEPLSPVGTFCQSQYYPDLIRAVKQPPTVWTCTKLPNMKMLSELIEAMESGLKCTIETTDLGVTISMNVDGGRGRLVLEGVGSIGWSEQLQLRSRFFSETTAALTMYLTDVVVRLNRFLPWLIKLAGGKVTI
ncbi:MAG: hypothetical protein NTY30_01345 [Candidatus Berkelbacteria bacterium]|nr:hypothetical protein [Candidatus Berkelbacteria bacterium]